MTTSFRDLRNPAAALDAAKKAAERTHEKSPAVLDVLARAQAAGGDKAEAVKTETKAIALLPVGDSALRKELESNLARFSAAGQK